MQLEHVSASDQPFRCSQCTATLRGPSSDWPPTCKCTGAGQQEPPGGRTDAVLAARGEVKGSGTKGGRGAEGTPTGYGARVEHCAGKCKNDAPSCWQRAPNTRSLIDPLLPGPARTNRLPWLKFLTASFGALRHSRQPAQRWCMWNARATHFTINTRCRSNIMQQGAQVQDSNAKHQELT